MDECRKRYGDVFTVRFTGLGPTRELVFLADPKAIRAVFSGDPATLHAGSGNAPLEPLLGHHSVLLLDGPEHMRQRKLMLPPLHGETMKSYEPMMRDITLTHMRNWPRSVGFRLLPYMQSITLEVILRTVFGFDDVPPRDRMRALLQRMLRFGSGRTRLLAFAFARFELGGHGPWGEFVSARRQVDDALFEQIRRRRAAGDTASRNDVLSLLLQARDQEGRAMSDEELHDELLTLLVAGHETTATALAWTFDLLLHHPSALGRLITTLEHGDGSLLDATIKESLRIRPVVPIVVRQLQEPFRVLDYELPAGVIVAPCIYLTQRRPDVYPQPARFQPERFLAGAPDPYAWLPFGGGVRRCLGASFATLEMRVVLRTVLMSAQLRAASLTQERVTRRAVTLVPRNGTRVIYIGERHANVTQPEQLGELVPT
jgi:cytochrome P450